MRGEWWLAILVLISGVSGTTAEELTAVERGRKALLERHYVPATVAPQAYQELWKQWGDLKEAPADYDAAVRERYGLHPAPYPNQGYPMGIRLAPRVLGFGHGLATDCLICHGGSIFGKSYVGLGNASLDIHAYFEEISAANGYAAKLPFTFTQVRGTSEAGGMAVYLLGLREPDLKLRSSALKLGLCDTMCEDTPAWWLLKKKQTMYATGGADARSVRSLMQFMLTPLNPPEVFEKEEEAFRDIQAYLLSLEAPPYPLPVDQKLARRGEWLFRENCAHCHGTYGDNGTYPNRIVPLEVIGTDRSRYDGISAEFARYYNKSWFAKERAGWFADEYAARPSVGYQAPPLDGIWATAPYLHNGSVPTVYDVLNSKSRPTLFTRSFRTGQDAYDPVKLGWKVQVLDQGPDPRLPAIERRKVYDTRLPGRGNTGHTFGDHLTDEERMAVIEYLKTL
ncbi:MAG: hypothetical protein ACK4RK_04520 [Gemmataceae bacterium]